MFSLLQSLKSVFAFLARSEPQHDRDEAYLAEAMDICDLERRMRAIDERARCSMPGISIGLFPN